MTALAPAYRRWAEEHGVLALALSIVVVVGLVYSVRLTLLADEVFSIDTARRSLPGTFRQALGFEMQPPVYFMLLNLWLRVSSSVLWARVLSTGAVILTVIVLDRQARLLNSGARLLPLFAALSPVLLLAGSYVRCYALAVLGIALSLLMFWKVFVAAGPSRVAWLLAFVVVAYGSVLTFYYSGFVVGAMFIAGLIVRPRSRSLWVAFGLLALLMAPWIPVVLRQAMSHPDLLPPVEHSGGALGAVKWFVVTAQDGLLGNVALLQRPGARSVVNVVVLGVVLCRLSSLRLRPWTREETALAVIAVVPVVVLAAMRYSNAFYVDNRHWAPAAVVPIVFAVTLASKCAYPTLRRVAFGVMVIVAGASAASHLRNFVNWPDCQAALAWMRSQGDEESRPIFVFRGEYALIFRYYVRADRVVALPREASLRRFPLADQVITNLAEVSGPIGAVVPPGGTFWLVQPIELRRFGGSVLDEFVRRRATVLSERDTALLKVQLVRMHAPLPVDSGRQGLPSADAGARGMLRR